MQLHQNTYRPNVGTNVHRSYRYLKSKNVCKPRKKPWWMTRTDMVWFLCFRWRFGLQRHDKIEDVLFYVPMLLLLILATSPWGLSELWGGGVPTSDIDHSGPRIRHLFLCTLISPPHPLLLPSDFPYPPSSSPSCTRTGSSAHLGITHLLPSISR